MNKIIEIIKNTTITDIKHGKHFVKGFYGNTNVVLTKGKDKNHFNIWSFLFRGSTLIDENLIEEIHLDKVESIIKDLK